MGDYALVAAILVLPLCVGYSWVLAPVPDAVPITGALSGAGGSGGASVGCCIALSSCYTHCGADSVGWGAAVVVGGGVVVVACGVVGGGGSVLLEVCC